MPLFFVEKTTKYQMKLITTLFHDLCSCYSNVLGFAYLDSFINKFHHVDEEGRCLLIVF